MTGDPFFVSDPFLHRRFPAGKARALLFSRSGDERALRSFAALIGAKKAEAFLAPNDVELIVIITPSQRKTALALGAWRLMEGGVLKRGSRTFTQPQHRRNIP